MAFWELKLLHFWKKKILKILKQAAPVSVRITRVDFDIVSEASSKIVNISCSTS